MTPSEAVDTLYARLREEPWFNTIGIGVHDGRTALYVYVKTTKGVRLPLTENEWQGFPVVVRKMGTPRPA